MVENSWIGTPFTTPLMVPHPSVTRTGVFDIGDSGKRWIPVTYVRVLRERSIVYKYLRDWYSRRTEDFRGDFAVVCVDRRPKVLLS